MKKTHTSDRVRGGEEGKETDRKDRHKAKRERERKRVGANRQTEICTKR